MPDVASVRKQEIRRLAKREIRVVAQQQTKQIQGLRNTIKNLRSQVMVMS